MWFLMFVGVADCGTSTYPGSMNLLFGAHYLCLDNFPNIDSGEGAWFGIKLRGEIG